MTVLGEEVPITELEKIEADRVDGVHTPANGIPFLLLKSLPEAEAEVEVETAAKGSRDCPSCDKEFDADHKGNTCPNCGADLPAADDAAKSLPPWHAAAVRLLDIGRTVSGLDLPPSVLFKAVTADGSVDEQPDIDGGTQAIALLGKLIGYEAQELAAGHLEEIGDIQLLAQASSLVAAWMSVERSAQMGDAGDAAMDQAAGLLAQSAANPGCGCCPDCTGTMAAKADLSTKDINDLPDSAFAHIESGGSKDEDGKTTPRSLRHFPVHDAAHTRNALSRLSGSPFGDKAKPKVMAAAKKFGIETSDDTSKSAVATEGTSVDTEPQGNDGIVAKAIADAVTKAITPLQERLESLDAELAKVKATPIPGGPLLRATQPARAADGEDWAAKAAYYRQMADSVSDPGTADGYRQLARQADDKAKP